MKQPWALLSLFLLGMILLASCQGNPAASQNKSATPVDPEAAIKAFLAKLGSQDRLLAEQQKYCPVMPEIRLGEIGLPYKVVVKGVPLIVCCKNCVEQAQENPDNTLAKLKELKEAQLDVINKQAHPSAGK